MQKEYFNFHFHFILNQWNFQALPVLKLFLYHVIQYWNPENPQDALIIKREWCNFANLIQLYLKYIDDAAPDEQLDETQKEYKSVFVQRIHNVYQESLAIAEHTIRGKRIAVLRGWADQILIPPPDLPSVPPLIEHLPPSPQMEHASVSQIEVISNTIPLSSSIPPELPNELPSTPPQPEPISKIVIENAAYSVFSFWQKETTYQPFSPKEDDLLLEMLKRSDINPQEPEWSEADLECVMNSI
ncbi:hypothetical protein A8135_14020 [Legionella jamestowniensis]|uniref:Uncharacterized protein n=1 Tax=Legionella jamestowniensis TaxID=455 RepID=A0ABX2XUN2_9GAMM|nr:hypothetical protein [Legionella jamestowniensis]OCH97604.1 hypothetical protein A8135_14020 [Legionella jamestowniensis]